MKVLRVRPKHYPEVIDIDCSLESLQKEVEGPIQAVYPWDDEVAWRNSTGRSTALMVSPLILSLEHS